MVILTLSFKPIENSSEIGKYQAFGTDKKKYMIDTSTGVLYYQMINVHKKWQRVSKEEVFAD